MDKHDIGTPALVLDLDLMEKNIAKMAEYFRGRKANVRPHIKTHKTPIIAHKQIEAGAEGITCAKLGEAEVMAAAGIKDILIANEVVGKKKIERLANLSKHCDVMVATDEPRNVEELAEAAQVNRAEINVLVDVNLSQNGKLYGILDRCGSLPGKPALQLARKVSESKGLNFKGLMGYEGGMGRFIEFEKRKEVCVEALKPLIGTKNMIEEAGMEVEVVSSGGTNTYSITGDYPGITEVQAGAYVFMDTHYKVMEGIDFDYALTLLTTVISRPYPEKAILDVGLKSITD
ncbi:MAG: DSD1 family PLP-dependent enzyme, partial [Nitrososphaeria archaeon]|nr:DSD1 family PLP-dependent enzyme [Nitrososphaeria archaeon]